ncbi:MAG: helix-turn-helix transcriptional regulator [Acidimicrobiia bacterium]|nr:helix-turn-helix transcriptional regulator [Acidimicrobiia bacterium]
MSARLLAARTAAGLSQVELAARAGVSRQLIGAAEAGRHLPRVDAAIAIAQALGVDIAHLFADSPMVLDVRSGTPPRDGALVRSVRVGELVVTGSAGIGVEGWDAADGIVEGGKVTLFDQRTPGIAVGGCEPGLELLERILRNAGAGAMSTPMSSTAAIESLDAGRLHAAVVHGPVGSVGDRVGDRSVDRYRLVQWRVGLAGPPDSGADWAARALAGETAVVQREAGAGVQRTFEEHAATDVPGPRVATHLAAARRAVLAGLPAVTIEPAALAVGAPFHALDVHEAELWVDRTWAMDRVVDDALTVLAGVPFTTRLAAIGGYDLQGCGDRIR